MPSEANVCEITFIVVIIDPMTLELEVMELKEIIYKLCEVSQVVILSCKLAKAFFGEDGGVFH